MLEEFTKAKFKYDPSTGVVTRDGRAMGSRHSGGYLCINVAGKIMLAHRLAWFLHFGEWPGDKIDHVNGVRSDNRIENLRVATPGQNMANARRRVDNKSGFKGVSWNKSCNRWQAHIRENGKSKYLGVFKTPEAAHEAYCFAAQRIFGEFARAA